jgi:hypothetical protein
MFFTFWVELSLSRSTWSNSNMGLRATLSSLCACRIVLLVAPCSVWYNVIYRSCDPPITLLLLDCLVVVRGSFWHLSRDLPVTLCVYVHVGSLSLWGGTLCYFTHRLCYAIAFTHSQQTLTHRKLLRARVFSHNTFTRRIFYASKLFRANFYIQKLWRIGAFGRFCTQVLWEILYAQVLLHPRFYTQKLLRTRGLTHRNVYTAKALQTDGSQTFVFLHKHTGAFTDNMQTLLHRKCWIFTQNHTDTFTQTACTNQYVSTFTHTHRIIYTQRLFTHVSMQMLSHKELLHTENFCTQNLFHTQTTF